VCRSLWTLHCRLVYSVDKLNGRLRFLHDGRTEHKQLAVVLTDSTPSGSTDLPSSSLITVVVVVVVVAAVVAAVFYCHTVHVVELLNYYTNHCTYIKFTH